MEQHDKKKYYKVICKNGKEKDVYDNPEIKAMGCTKIEEMSDIGKLTHLFWGYNIVDKHGLVMRKFKFLDKYPVQVAKVLKWVYPDFFHFTEEKQQTFRDEQLNGRMLEIGFTIQKTKLTR